MTAFGMISFRGGGNRPQHRSGKISSWSDSDFGYELIGINRRVIWITVLHVGISWMLLQKMAQRVTLFSSNVENDVGGLRGT